MNTSYNKKALFWFLIIFSFTILSCSQSEVGPLKIAVSKLYPNYEKWLLQSDSTLVITDMYPMGVDSALKMLGNHHGLLVTGGEDVFPDWYGMIEDTARCGEFDFYRDTLEIMLIRRALELKMPVLGICRGHQILNVTLGGTLIIDIPEDVGTEILHRCEDYLACHHEVMITAGSLLQEITGQTAGTVNTNHHQAVKELASGLKISALSHEGLIEAIEWETTRNRSFLLGVQWHPERMEDYPELSVPVAERFISEAGIKAKAAGMRR